MKLVPKWLGLGKTMEFNIPDEYKRDPWPPERYEPILIEVGRLVFNWNSIENTTRELLNNFVSGGPKVEILTQHMGSQSQIEALKLIARSKSEEEKKAIHHAANLYEILRSYRNFFVHGFNTIVTENITLDFGSEANPVIIPTNRVAAKMTDRVAKREYREDTLTLTYENLQVYSNVMRGSVHYFNLLFCYFKYIDSEREEHKKYKLIPIEFPIPPKLEKEKRTLPMGN